jgi:hypothetical protein
MTGGLPSIAPSWRQAPWGSQPEIFFIWTLAVIVLMWHPPWREDGVVSYEYAWPCQVYVSHIQHVIDNSSFCTTHKSSVSPGFPFQPSCYNTLDLRFSKLWQWRTPSSGIWRHVRSSIVLHRCFGGRTASIFRVESDPSSDQPEVIGAGIFIAIFLVRCYKVEWNRA